MFLFAKFRWSWMWTLTAIAGSFGIFVAVSVYFDPTRTAVFLLEKGGLRDHPLWRTAFYFHVVGACVCLATGPLLMFLRLIRVRRFHAVIGYIYLNAVLWIAAPAGLIISPAAKAGWLSALGFSVTGILWWCSTWRGYQTIGKIDIRSHICWMLRSYSIALSAVWFRIVQHLIGFSVPSVSDSTNYIVSVWLSLLISVWISETCIHRFFGRDRATLGRPAPFVSAQ
ncbi:MAG: DUF2306 domain-containing protein [Planctomycetota bacterium]